MATFQDRKQAGQLLAETIQKQFSGIKEAIVLALPRGGVVVAAEVSKKLKLPLDIITTRKIGAPENPEYAIAACGLTDLVFNEREKINLNYLEKEIEKERQEIKRRMRDYRGKRPYPRLKNQTVFLIDDGLATGLTMEVAVKEIKKLKPKEIIVGTPVAPPSAIEHFKTKVKKLIVLKVEPLFFAVGQFYANFPQISDQEVKKILESFWATKKSSLN